MNLEGCYVAIVTPFTTEGTVDEEGLRANIRYLIDNGVAGIVPCGTTGESATLSWEEHNRVVEIAIEEGKGKVSVIAGAGSNNTIEAVEAAKHAHKCGADAILCITPYYNKPSQEGLFQHFKEVVTNVDVPVVLYNVPGRTGINMLPETVERLCDYEQVVAIKEASGDLVQVSEINRRCGDRLTILSGDDALTLPMLTCGAKGVISVIGNLLPAKMSAMIQDYFDLNITSACDIHKELLPLSNAMFMESSPAPIKAAMDYAGLTGGTLRLPMTPMTAGGLEQLHSILAEGGVAKK